MGDVFTGTLLEPSTAGGFGAEQALKEKIIKVVSINVFFICPFQSKKYCKTYVLQY